MFSPSFRVKALIALVVALVAALPAQAQSSFGPSGEPADKRVSDTIATPYFQALLQNFAESVRKSGDPACLQANALDDGALVARGQALFQRYGVQMTKLLDEGFDRAAYEAALRAAEGPGAVAEIERLKRDRDVAALIVLYRPAQLASAADRIMEQFDRYALIKRIKLYPVAPIARGEIKPTDHPSAAMRANPTEAAETAIERFIDEHPSPRIVRYLEIMDAADAAMQKAIKREVALKLGPTAYFAGVERDLAELCVGSR
jgi:hypothetical protein